VWRDAFKESDDKFGTSLLTDKEGILESANRSSMSMH